MTRPLLAVLLLAAACADTGYSGRRYTSNEDGISFAQPSGWQVTRERSTLLLRRPGRAATIAIRTIPRDGWSSARTMGNVVPAVATTLRALPGARVTGPTDLATSDYSAVVFDVDFSPPGHGRHQRRHVTLIGDNRVIHVFLVAPLGELATSRRDLETIVKTIHEEG